MFSRIFGKYLLLTNTVSSGVLMAAGDLIQQEIEKHRTLKSKPFDWKRTGLCYTDQSEFHAIDLEVTNMPT
jgi:protein Mpv17